MDYNVISFGAVGDGATDDSKSIQKAIDACEKTGGRVVLPSGYCFYSSSVTVKKNTELHIEKGAVLKATGDINGYFRPCDRINDPKTALDGNPVTGKPSFAFIYGYKADGFKLTGEGTVDGNCYAFVERVNEYYVTGNFYPRPTMLYIENSRDIVLNGVTFTNAPFWTVHPGGCQNVLIDSIRILNPLDVANSDGIDPDHCQGVEIRNCEIRCADDCVCLKNTMGNSEYDICRDVYVHDCLMTSTSAAIKIGTEGIADFENILFERCEITDSNRGLSIQIRDCGSVRNAVFSDISVSTRRFHSSWWGTAEPIIVTSLRRDESTVSGKICAVTFRNITCDGENGVLIYCDNGEISDISFENVRSVMRKKTKWRRGLYDLRPGAEQGIEEHKNHPIRIRNASDIRMVDSSFILDGEESEEFSASACFENASVT